MRHSIVVIHSLSLWDRFSSLLQSLTGEGVKQAFGQHICAMGIVERRPRVPPQGLQGAGSLAIA